MLSQAIVRIPILITIVTIFWEHVASINKFSFKPSVIIGFIADKAIVMWEFIGRIFGHLSSFITYLKFEELYKSVHTLGKEIWRLLASPLYGIREYFNVAYEYRWPVLIGIGSLLILGAVAYGLYWVDGRYFGFVFQKHVVTSQ